MLRNLIDAHSHYFGVSGDSQRAHIIDLIYRRILSYYEFDRVSSEVKKELEDYLVEKRDYSSTHLMILLILDKIESYE
jgi:hypothetical protein